MLSNVNLLSDEKILSTYSLFGADQDMLCAICVVILQGCNELYTLLS